jgi:hypothetical protein
MADCECLFVAVDGGLRKDLVSELQSLQLDNISSEMGTGANMNVCRFMAASKVLGEESAPGQPQQQQRGSGAGDT